jgi:hypothetical protein
MKGFSLLHAGACLSLVASTVIGAAVTPRSEITRRQDGPNSTNFTPTIGVPGGEVLQRLPIKRLRHEQPDVFNMFILALDSFKKKDPSDFMSWFRISGAFCWKTTSKPAPLLTIWIYLLILIYF